MGAKRYGIILLAITLVGGCGWALNKDEARVSAKACSDAPQTTIERFLKAVAQFSFDIIQVLVPDGISPFAIFGGGDRSRGKEVVMELIRHPEPLGPGISVGMDAALDEKHPIERVSEDEWMVPVIRADVIANDDPDKHDPEIVREYRRVFRARIDSANCLRAVQSIDHAWQRVK